MRARVWTLARFTMVTAAIILVLLFFFYWPKSAIRIQSAPSEVSNGARTTPLGTSRVSSHLPVLSGTNLNVGVLMELCGHGKIPFTEDHATSAEKQVELSVTAAYKRWVNDLLNSDNLRARVAGLILGRNDSLTGDTPDMGWRGNIVQLAVGSNDPVIYGVGVEACSSAYRADPASGCEQLTAERWAQLAPDNAVPWLVIAENARATHNTTAEAMAYQQAANATVYQRYDTGISQAAIDLQATSDPVERLLDNTTLFGTLISALGMPPLVGVSHYCVVPLSDAVKAQCAGIAEMLVGDGADLVTLSIGIKIGNAVGWPRDRIASLQSEKESLQQTVTLTGTPPASCERLEQTNAVFEERARRGEVASLRLRMQQAAKKTQENGASQ